MDETDFKIITVLSQTRNLTKAADIMNITQSAISKRITAMECELKTKLFTRGHNGVHFTPDGEKVLEYCLNITKQISEMRLCLQEKKGNVYGSLNVGVSDNYMLYHLPDLVASFHNKYPNVNLKIKTEKSHILYPQVLSDKLDIAIIRGDYSWDGVKVMISNEAMCVVYNREFCDKDLNSFMYVDRDTDSVQYSLMNKWRHENGIQLNSNVITVDSISSCMDLVKKGMGWALIPEIALDDYTGCIKPCYFADTRPFVRTTYLYCKSDTAKLSPAKAFIAEAVSKKKIYPYAGGKIQ